MFKSSLLRMKCLQPHSAELFHWHYSAATILATYLTMLEVVVAENILCLYLMSLAVSITQARANPEWLPECILFLTVLDDTLLI